MPSKDHFNSENLISEPISMVDADDRIITAKLCTLEDIPGQYIVIENIYGWDRIVADTNLIGTTFVKRISADTRFQINCFSVDGYNSFNYKIIQNEEELSKGTMFLHTASHVIGDYQIELRFVKYHPRNLFIMNNDQLSKLQIPRIIVTLPPLKPISA
jgi:hypothetical protein